MEKKSFGGSGFSGEGSLAGGEDDGDLLCGAFSEGDIEEGASDISDHFVQKAIPFKFEAEALKKKKKLKAIEGFDGVF